MRILAIGDIFGKPGRKAIQTLVPQLIDRHQVDVVVANAENAAHGRGLTPDIAEAILKNNVDVLTAGNHTLEHQSIYPSLESGPLLRPENVKANLPGKGWFLFTTRKGPKLAVISLQGRVFMEGKGAEVGDPFQAIDQLLPALKEKTSCIVVDFHAEATSEKRALAWYLDGRVSALWGTHTHVQTADEQIMPKGMAYISDLGMTGPHASVVGLDKDIALERFLTGKKSRYEVAEGDVRLEGILLDIDERSGKTFSIVRIREYVEKNF
ncbi:MAG: metallophosphoesterase [Deltaproteobacteria bacterium RIFCSPLOWO2_02_FULL_44_10]|nr:MAG: metallophosphoesterase [Deltaproteobacteria bacterium RIFCSPHIGHO2_02_FULL_44_16]OGQ46975.1 MAG: metallophosphoesterase [Deltaproteobacteria bacterium RIFCSPLOWO2_02_FULL_44_10]